MEPSLRTAYDELLELRFLIEKNQNEIIKRVSLDERTILLKLNESPIKTYLIMDHGKEYTAEDMSHVTGNARAHESSILNQLACLNLLEKIRRSKTVYFRKTSGTHKEYLNDGGVF